jgi:hypothetical protein
MLQAWALEGSHLQEYFIYYGRIIIPNDATLIKVHMSIKSIKAEAFKDHRLLTTVILNDGLEEVGEEAFYKCISLQGIVVPPTPTVKLILREGVSIQKLCTVPFGYGEHFALMVNSTWLLQCGHSFESLSNTDPSAGIYHSLRGTYVLRRAPPLVLH